MAQIDKLRYVAAVFRQSFCPLTIFLILVLSLVFTHVEAQEDHLPIYRIEKIEIRGNKSTKSSLIRNALHFQEGQILSVDDPNFELSRLRLLSLGFFF